MKWNIVTRSVAAIGVISLAGALGACAQSGSSTESTYPSRAITLTVPLAAGGATDLAARAVASSLSNELGQPVNVENKPGANQVTGVSAVLSQPADGYSLLADGASSSSLQSVKDGLPYQWDNRTFVAKVATGTHVFATGKKSGITTLDQAIERIKSDPGSFKVAWLGGTTTSDYALLQLFNAIDVSIDSVTKVPYDGSGPAMEAAATGDVDLVTGGSSAALSLSDSGDVIPLAVTADDVLFPDVPTTEESGYSSVNMTWWVGLSAPAGLPGGVSETLQSAVQKIGNDASVEDQLKKLGMSLNVVTGSDAESAIRDEASEVESLTSGN